MKPGDARVLTALTRRRRLRPYICADASGVSKRLTEKFLGKAAVTKLFSQSTFDTSEFTFANGVFCDAKE